MFTGIVTDLGRVRSIERRGDTRFTLATSYEVEAIALGARQSAKGFEIVANHFLLSRFQAAKGA